MICTLMNKNIAVCDLEIDSGDVIWVGPAINEKYAPVCVEIDDGCVNRADVSHWYKHRSIPASRDNLRNGLENLGYQELGHISTPTFLLEKNYGLSLSDQYWLKPEGSNLEWSNINYFTNGFSDDVGKALFDNLCISSPDLNSPCNSSDGWLNKKWTIIEGKRCLIKSGSKYHQEPYNEVIASEICRLLDINHTPYTLMLSKGGKAYSMCENFIDENTELVSANDIVKSFLPNPRVSFYEHFTTCCKRLGLADVTDRLDEMLVVDYIIGNQDRHLRNFGVIRNVETLKYKGFAPIFDTGTSLRYDTPYDEIDADYDIPALPFDKTHSQQIKLVKNKDRFDLSKLKQLPEFVRQTLSRGDIIKRSRADVLTKVIEKRISSLDKELCKGIVKVPDTNKRKNSSSRGR